VKPRLLDLFCGAGGATKGYQLAGFHVTGVDINPQPNYCGDAFVQADAMTFPLDGYDLIHASPPCQRYSAMSVCRPGLADNYPDLVAATRARLEEWGGRYVIENVPRAPLLNPVTLCGFMFGLRLYRHRLFESNRLLLVPDHPRHTVRTSRAGHYEPGTIISVAGNCAPIGVAREVMGIGWTNRAELAEAIPPAYTWFLGEQLGRKSLT
jgi:DNA (cytosine-5)-methyltransferase 1